MTLDIENKILIELGDWELNKGGLPPVLRLYRELLLVQSEARAKLRMPAFKLSKDVISNRLENGQPLLEFEEIPIDWAVLRDLVQKVSSVFVCYEESHTEKFDLSEPETLKTTLEAWYKGKAPEGNAIGPVLNAALKPFLDISIEALQKSLDHERWLRPICPICGGAPDFSFLDKERGARHLVCSRCDAEWLFKRMECPYCSNQDQTKLAYFTDESGLYRLYVCEKCKNYLKAIDLRSTESQILMPLERFKTLDLDSQACQNGYTISVGIEGQKSKASIANEELNKFVE